MYKSGMPWKASSVVNERMRCVWEQESGLHSMTELCAVNIRGTVAHFNPLKTNETSSEKRHKDGSFGPTQRRPFEADHLLFDFCELIGGRWLWRRGVYRPGDVSIVHCCEETVTQW